jgi:hypothetical protein
MKWLAGLLIALLPPAVAHGAWSPPQPVAGATPGADAIGLEIAPDGRRLAWWTRGFDPEDEPPRIPAATAAPGDRWWGKDLAVRGGFLSVARLGPARLAAAPFLYYLRRGLPVWTLTNTGRVIRRVLLQPREWADFATLGASPNGHAAVVWARAGDLKHRTPLLLAHRRGRGFGDPIVVARHQRPGRRVVAVNDRGDALVVWGHELRHYSGEEVRARLVRADGRLGPLTTLARLRGFVWPDISAAITRDGRGAVSWAIVDFDDYVGAPAAVATMRPGGRFSKPLQLTGRSAVGKAFDVGRTRVAATSSDELVVAWTDGRPHFYEVLAGVLRRGRLMARQRLSAPERDGQLLDLARAPDGRVAALWTSDWDESGEQQEFFDAEEAADEEHRTPVELLAAVRPRGGRFGPAERVSSDADRRPIPDGAIDFDPVTRGWAATWIDGIEDAAEARSSGSP